MYFYILSLISAFYGRISCIYCHDMWFANKTFELSWIGRWGWELTRPISILKPLVIEYCKIIVFCRRKAFIRISADVKADLGFWYSIQKYLVLLARLELCTRPAYAVACHHSSVRRLSSIRPSLAFNIFEIAFGIASQNELKFHRRHCCYTGIQNC